MGTGPRGRDLELGWGSWLFAVVYGAFAVVYTDYLAYQAVGKIVSFALAGVIVATALVSFRKGLYAALLVLFTMPTFPRDILDIYTELLVTRYIEFNSIKFMSVAGFTLAQWVFVALFGIAFVRFLLHGGRIASRFASQAVALMFTLVIVMLLGAVIAAFAGQPWDLREFIGDFRFPMLFTFGLFIGWAYTDSVRSPDAVIAQFLKFLVLLVIVSGIKSVFFLVDDALADTFRLGFANPNYVTFPFLIALVIMRQRLGISRSLYYALLVLGTFSIIPEGRGAIVIYIIVMALAAGLVIVNDKAGALRFVLSMAGIVVFFILALLIVTISNERFRDYLALKALFFTEELFQGEYSASPTVRIYEFKNIMAENYENVAGLLWGKGAGGYFQYEHYPLSFAFSISDYSERELDSERYYHPHLPINFWLLKGGIVALGLYTLVYYRMFIAGKRSLAHDAPGTSAGEKLFLYFIVLSAPIGFIQSYWQPEYSFYFAIILMIFFVHAETARGADPSAGKV
jgi:hypothetical protein